MLSDTKRAPSQFELVTEMANVVHTNVMCNIILEPLRVHEKKILMIWYPFIGLNNFLFQTAFLEKLRQEMKYVDLIY